VPGKTLRSVDALEPVSPTPREGSITTFMLKNIPHRIDVSEMLDMLNNVGLGSDYYDFFYMPHDGRAKFTKGYAFINICDGQIANEFIRRVDGMMLQEKPNKKVQVFGAAEQGVIRNLLTIQHTNWTKKEQFPLVRINGLPRHLTPIAAINEISSSTHMQLR
jgi:RNA recognition motif-containing protein